MNKKYTLFLIVTFILICFSCKREDDNKDLFSTETIIQDIQYGNDVNNVMDLFLPAGRSNQTPLLVLVHGGYWIQGDKSELSELADLFIKNNVAVACINYRFIPQYKYIDMMSDVDISLQFLVEKCEEYGFSSDKLFIAGLSSGGHIALLYAYGFDKHELIDGVIGICSPTNFDHPELLSDPLYVQLLENLIGVTYEDNPDLWRDSSPYYHVSSSTCQTILAHCMDDEVVPFDQAIELEKKLKDNNVPVQTFYYEEGNHEFIGVDLTSMIAAALEMINE